MKNKELEMSNISNFDLEMVTCKVREVADKKSVKTKEK